MLDDAPAPHAETPPATPAATPWWLRPALHAAAVVLAALAVHAVSIDNAYHLDDFPRIVDNPQVRRILPLARHFLDPGSSSVIPQVVQYRPLLPLSLSLTHRLGESTGLGPLVAHHLGNLALHAGAALLAWLLFVELLVHRSGLAWSEGRRRLVALVGAVAFAVHPVSGVPVTYLAARDLLLMQVFLHGFLLAYARLRRLGGTPLRWTVALALLSLSLLAKTNAAAAPLLVLFFELSVGGARLSDLRAWARAAVAAAPVAGFFLLTRALGFSDADMLLVDRPPWEYPATQLKLHVAWYLRNLAWPFRMRPLPDLHPVGSPFDPLTLLGLAVVAVSLVAAWRVRRRRPVVAFAIGAYWAAFSPTSSVLPFRLLATDYRQYPALPWACLLVALALFAGLRGRTLALACAAVLAWWSATAVVMDETWQDEVRLWSHSVSLGGATIAHYNLGMALVATGDDAAAEPQLLAAIAKDGNNVRAHVSLGLLWLRRSETERGLARLQEAVAMAPGWALTHYWLARGLEQVGRVAEAAPAAAKAAELEPQNPEHLYRAAWDAQAARDYGAALRFVRDLHERHGPLRDSLFIEGWTLQSLGREDEAIDAYARHLEHEPGHVQARFNRALALAERGRCAEAEPELRRVLALKADYHAAHLHLSRCLARLGRADEADAEMRLWQGRGQ